MAKVASKASHSLPDRRPEPTNMPASSRREGQTAALPAASTTLRPYHLRNAKRSLRSRRISPLIRKNASPRFSPHRISSDQDPQPNQPAHDVVNPNRPPHRLTRLPVEFKLAVRT